MADILSIGKSALNAASVAISTTGHNIANAATPGYNRQVVLQAAVAGQNMGFGFIGKGTEITDVRRIYNDFLGNQILSAQTSKSQLDTYYTQIRQIDNMMADSSVGLSPALQDFFKGVQNVSAAASSAASRQSLLSSADTMVARFQSMDAQLNEIRQGVNDQIVTSVTAINTYARQIAQLNDAIEMALGAGDGKRPNDLLDQRDLAIAELSKEIKVSVVKQGNSYDVYIGNGQPLVVNANTYDLKAVQSPTDPSRMMLAYEKGGATTILSETGLSGGNLSGLLEFRNETLDVAQNALGRVAIALASDFNAQHRLGMDLNGDLGEDFFTVAQPLVNASSRNQGSGNATAAIVDASALTTSDYQLQFDGSKYTVTRMSDGTKTVLAPSAFPATIDGVEFGVAAITPSSGDTFMIRPTANGAAGIGVAIRDVAKIASAVPIRTAATSTNAGTGTISAGTVDTNFALATVASPITLTFDEGPPGTLTGFPNVPVNVTVNGVAVAGSPFAAGAPVTYTDGATISFAGISFTLSGTPTDNDQFTIASNAGGVGDNRNMLLLGALQAANTIGGKTTNYQGAYSQLVNLIGNKTAELEASSTAADQLLTQAIESQQAESGVNLDEEAANLIRYQQAYQAAAQVMRTASDLFDTLLSIGH